jgi:hypothetical protein
VIAPIINTEAHSLELFGRSTGYLRDDVGGTPVVLVVSADATASPAANDTSEHMEDVGTIDLAPDDYTQSQ